MSKIKRAAILPVLPKEVIKNGLLIVFEGNELAYGDIIDGQQMYHLPQLDKEIKGVYMKLKTE